MRKRRNKEKQVTKHSCDTCALQMDKQDNTSITFIDLTSDNDDDIGSYS